MVSKEQKKLNRVINFVKKGLSGLADELEGTVKAITDFTKSLKKAQNDLKDVSAEEVVQTVSTSSKKVAAPGTGGVKAAAANTLFSLLSGSEGQQAAAPRPAMTAAPKAPAPPGSGGPPKAPGGGPPKAPGGGPPSRANLPPAPKLPPTSGPPVAPPGGAPPSPYAKRPGPPAPPGGSRPPAPPGSPATANTAGGGLSSLRDEMLDELTRLKKIMRGES
ncbi:MAG: hypothetical protein ACFFAS_17820 [Promethearchaeota archaeon]